MGLALVLLELYQGLGYLLRLFLYLCFWLIAGTFFSVAGLFNTQSASDGVKAAKEGYQSFVVRGEFPEIEGGGGGG